MDSDDMDWRRPAGSKPAVTAAAAAAAPPPATKSVPQAAAPVAASKEPEVPVLKGEDKWDGEDENGDAGNVKDNWDDEDEEVPPPVPSVGKLTSDVKAVQIKTKKGKKIIKKYEDKGNDEEELTSTEIEAKKLREEKLRDAEELRLTKEAFGITSDKTELLDIVNPITKDDFDGLRKKMMEDLSKFSKRSAYQDFLEDLIVDLSVCLPAKRLKKVKTSIEVLYFEKSKIEKVKPVAGSGKSASSKGIKLHVEGDRAILKQRDADEFDDYDDFM